MGRTGSAPTRHGQVESGRELGEVRRFRVPLFAGLPWIRLTSRDRTTAFEPPRRWVYGLLSGVPGVTDYTADVTLVPTSAGGTDIRWRVAFRAKIPGIGGALRWRLHRLYAVAGAGLARAAEA
jgi:Polyketide cyclase / dehydrase and lipid transport